MRDLYPEISPSAHFMLDTGSPHRVYVEACGNPHGIPVLFVHGGPGSGCTERHRRFFDPARYRIVLFDQRGCGRSTPRGLVDENRTEDLLADMEAIRLRLDISRWLVFGGSWGSTLSLLYAERYPERVAALILRGVFLARRRDLDWFARDGACRILPDRWAEFLAPIPASEWHDLVAAYHSRVHGADPGPRAEAALAWTRWEDALCGGMPAATADPARVDKVRIATHYARHAFFIPENEILENVHRLPSVPVRIIHGRRDLTCTLDASWDLRAAIPGAELVIVENGGHLAADPPMTDALVSATDDMASRLA